MLSYLHLIAYPSASTYHVDPSSVSVPYASTYQIYILLQMLANLISLCLNFIISRCHSPPATRDSRSLAMCFVREVASRSVVLTSMEPSL
ncbi:hypothetical protein L227DRAFT_184532 [Lentinus tigrinus ALCF2SS1-6]|uniref:Uncharacterized protein n=1 Tax=Lentinus tigrinus ALCF2SS1-6 TaxID=1328759 RepID=A0A5C2S6K7_9APHY|nr:hypothetical protein L227DRAFT_184532 [Lentinus tigrinus ALCF2SS1-6]